MRPGPPPKPTAIKRREGNPGKKRLNENEPQPTIGCRMPDWLPEGAQKYWAKYAPEAEQLGILTVVDEVPFAAYCVACWNYERAVKALKPTKDNPNPNVQTAKSGYQTSSGWEMVRSRAVDEIRKLGTEFGFTAAARSRIETTPRREDDLEALLSDGETN